MNEQEQSKKTSEVYLELELLQHDYEQTTNALNYLVGNLQDSINELNASEYISKEIKIFMLSKLATINEMQLDYSNNLYKINNNLNKVMQKFKYENQEQA